MRITSRAWPCDCGCEGFQQPESESPFYFDDTDGDLEDRDYDQLWEARKLTNKAPRSEAWSFYKESGPFNLGQLVSGRPMDEAPYPYYAGFLAETFDEHEYWETESCDPWYHFKMLYDVMKKFMAQKFSR
jgi:hypothetical protein